MIIAIDYDETWTAFPGLWRDFVASCRQRGITVIIVTNRSMDMHIGDPGKFGVEAVVYANGRPKREAAHLHDFNVDIWIDDLPHLVDFGYCQVEEVKAMRTENIILREKLEQVRNDYEALVNRGDDQC